MQLPSHSILSVLLAASCVSANLLHIIPGDVERRDKAEHKHVGRRSLSRRAQASNAAQFATIHDNTQCQPYGVDAVTQMKNQKDFPPVGQIASIIQGDSQAQQIWQEIQNSGIVPSDVQVKQDSTNGQHMGTSANGYNVQQDPDCWWTANSCKQPKHQGLITDLYTCPEPDTWGLTFDDGPNCTHNAFYDFLSQNKLKATLFYIGTNVADWPYQAQRGLVDGHDICVHTWSHHYTTTLQSDQVFAELYYTAKIIKQIIGVTPTCWRPPYGDVDDRVRAIAQGLGLRTIVWEEDTDDWNIQPGGNQPTSKIDSNYQNIINKAQSESPIVLTHEINQQTMDEFTKLYPKVKNAYKNLVPLTACQNITKPYADGDITYPAFSDFVSGKVNASGLPNGNTIKVDPSAKYTPQELNKTQNGYGHPQDGSQASSSSGSGGSEKSSKSAAAPRAYASPVFSLLAVVLIFLYFG